MEGNEESVKALLDRHYDMGGMRPKLGFDMQASWKDVCTEVGAMRLEQRPKTRREWEKLTGAGRQAQTGSVGRHWQGQVV